MVRLRMVTERQVQILTALENCILRQGLTGTSLHNVADEAGLPRPLVRYFVGKRKQKVTVLFERIIARGEQAVASHLQIARTNSADDLLQLLNEGVFGNDTCRVLIGELWHAAERDEAVRDRWKALYQSVLDGVVRDPATCHRVAIALVTMSFGHASLQAIGLRPAAGNCHGIIQIL